MFDAEILPHARLDTCPPSRPAAVSRAPAERGFETLRIIHCVRAPIGGIFRHVLDLAAEQSARGHQVGIVLDSETGGAFEADKIQAAAPHLALGVTRLPMSRSIKPQDLVSAWRVYTTVRGLRPDVLHGHGAKGGTFARLIGTALSRRSRPVARLYTPHGGSLHYDPATRAGQVIFALERGLERLCDRIIHVSRYEATIYRDKVGVPRCPVAVVVNGLRRSEYEPLQAEPEAADFLFMGMLRDLKGPDVFIRALALLGEGSGQAPTAAIVGDGPDLARYQALIADLGLEDRVRLHPSQPTRVGLGMARCIVVPSRAESMPYIVLEATAANVPLIATRVGGIPEILDETADTLVPAGQVEALADAMRVFLRDPEGAMKKAERARTALRRRFTVEAMTGATDQLYRAALLRRSAVRRAFAAATLQAAE